MVGNLPKSAVVRARHEPVRTCIGCRERAARSELIRVVALRDSVAQAVTPDLDGSAGGRGAHLHPTASCLELADKRRAFPRALRLQGHVDVSMLWAYVRSRPDQPYQTESSDAVTEKKRSTSS